MGLHSHEEVTENLFQGFVHNRHVNDINHVIAHKQTSLSVRSGAIFPLPLAYARFAAPVLSHHEKARRRRWLRMSHHRFKVAPVAVGALASGFGLRLQKAKGWLSAIVCRSAELVHGGLHYSYCRETRIEWLLYCLNTIRARGVIST